MAESSTNSVTLTLPHPAAAGGGWGLRCRLWPDGSLRRRPLHIKELGRNLPQCDRRSAALTCKLLDFGQQWEVNARRRPMRHPGKYLMLAVLDQAVTDLQNPSFNVRRQARAWFLARGARANHIFAFSHICQEFGRDPGSARVRLLAKFDGNPGGVQPPQDRPQRAAS